MRKDRRSGGDWSGGLDRFIMVMVVGVLVVDVFIVAGVLWRDGFFGGFDD